MTSKRKQIKRIPISIFFSESQIPKEFRKIKFEEYEAYSFFKSDQQIFVNLSKISNLNILQKNYRLLLIGSAINRNCGSGDYFIDYFGCSKSEIKNFFLGWELADYSFEKYKSKKKLKNKATIVNKYEKETKSISDSYFYIRDLINTPANILGPKEIFQSSKNFLKDFDLINFYTNKKLEKDFPLISAVGGGADDSKKPIFCEFKLSY